MKKKLLLLLVVVMAAVCMFTGCSEGNTKPLSNVDGNVVSGNGSFLVEKGDYLYFVNGESSTTSDNAFGTPVKSSLVRVKKTDLANPSNANVETVVPKIMLTGSYTTGVYFYGDYVYYATPCSDKDKTGTIQNTKTEFNRLNLKTGKAGSILAISDSNTAQFRYTQVGDKVYLVYTFTETDDDDNSVNKFKAIDTSNGKTVYTSEKYNGIAFADDSSDSVFFTKTAYSETREQDESFYELYSYKIGDADAKLVLSGAGSYALDRDGRDNLTDNQLCAERGIEGVTFTLIKNTGKNLIYKVTTLDSSYTSNIYYGAEIENGTFKASTEDVKNPVRLGDSESFIDAALTSNSYYESLDSIYYIDSTYGLIKYNYKNNTNDLFGTEVVSVDCKDMAISFVSGDYMYLCNTSEGFYYRANYKASKVEVKKINAVAMQTPTDFYLPRVIGNYFIGSYSHEAYYSYVYVIDMSNIDTPKAEGEDQTVYEKYLEDTAKTTRENFETLNKTLLGTMTDSDKDLFDEYLDTNYPED